MWKSDPNNLDEGSNSNDRFEGYCKDLGIN